jgi:hypothetical protein
MRYRIRNGQLTTFVACLLMMLFTLCSTVFYLRLWLSPRTGIPDPATLTSSQGTVAWVKEVTYRRSRDHIRFRLEEAAREFIYDGDSDSMQAVFDALKRSRTQRVTVMHAGAGEVAQAWELSVGNEIIGRFSDKALHQVAANRRGKWLGLVFLVFTGLLFPQLYKTLRRRADWRESW